MPQEPPAPCPVLHPGAVPLGLGHFAGDGDMASPAPVTPLGRGGMASPAQGPLTPHLCCRFLLAAWKLLEARSCPPEERVGHVFSSFFSSCACELMEMLQSRDRRASPAGVAQPSSAHALVSVGLGWAGRAQVPAVCFAGWSERDLKEVRMQETRSDGLLIKYITVDVNNARNPGPSPPLLNL